MFKLAFITLLSLSLTGCLTDDTKTIDPTVQRDDDEANQPGDDDTDDNGCRLRKDGELDCPSE